MGVKSKEMDSDIPARIWLISLIQNVIYLNTYQECSYIYNVHNNYQKNVQYYSKRWNVNTACVYHKHVCITSFSNATVVKCLVKLLLTKIC